MDKRIPANFSDLWSSDSELQNMTRSRISRQGEALALIEMEPDLTYRKKYATLWKSR